MKITIVTGPFLPLPPDGFGAVEVIWFDLAREFAARGHDVTILSRSWPNRPKEEVVDRVRILRRGGFQRPLGLKWALIKDLLYTGRLLFSIPAADICVTNVVALPVILPRLRPKAGRVVVNVGRAPKGQMKFYNRTARLACTSSAVAMMVEQQSPGVRSITKVLPNPINTLAFVPPRVPRVWNGRRYLTYTGRIHPEKGVHVLIQAFGKLLQSPGSPVDLVLRIIGPTATAQGGAGEGYLSGLKKMCEGLPVEFIPPIADRNALAEVLRQSHYYCYPSLAEKGESFGVAPLEAMATGLVPVVSDLLCFRDFVEEGVNGWIFDHRTDAVGSLHRVLSRVVADTDGAIQMGHSAVATAARYSNSAVAELYLNDFEQLLKGGAA